MKKIFTALLLTAMLLISSVAFAAYNETVPEDSEISSVKRLAIAFPRHYKTLETEPTDTELSSIMANASRVARCYVISYDEIAADIKKDTGVDINELEYNEAEKVFESNVGKYADAFVVVTTATNGKKVQYFFDVYKPDETAVYSLTTQSGDWSRDLKGYTKACEDFYKKFDAAAEQKLKDEEKQARKKK
ncbi:MAG: coenzyme F(420) biosynthesis enzyme [Selenomonadaceae bacterium]|nr:coenzyme F(420) biosynthesis enzyme [Selenomonadaceae bacterium]